MTSNDLENMAIGLLSSMAERTPATVRTVLRQLLPLTGELAARLTADDLEEIARRIEARLYIKMEDAAAIQMAFAEWLPQRRTDTPGYFYPRYRTYLGTRGFAPAVLGVLDKDTDKIVGLFQDPKKQGAWQRRGLVVGHVQSGKTANYTATIGVLLADGTLVDRAVIETEVRTEKDLYDRVSGGAGPGGVKAVAPAGAEFVQFTLPEAALEASILGEKLTMVRPDGTDQFTAPGRPVASISNVMVEYRPKPAPKSPAKPPVKKD